MVFTTWSFVLMSAHVGLHWNMMIGAIRKWTKRTQYLYQIFLLLVSAYGLYAFISRNLLQRMFLLSEYEAGVIFVAKHTTKTGSG